LFDPATIARMAAHFETLLRLVVIQPDLQLDALAEALARLDRQQQDTTRQRYRQINFQKLKTVKRKTLGLPQLNRNGTL
jgi:non-ribosomal peptide synthetase component F